MCIIKFTVSLLISGIFFNSVSTLKLTSIEVPPYTARGQPVLLQCNYDLQNGTLLFVKWYKDDIEFYRFNSNGSLPYGQVFTISGIKVDLENSNDTSVYLNTTDWDGTGYYQCDVVVDDTFTTVTTVSDSRKMIVAEKPGHNPPIIIGGKTTYKVGESIRINCTTSWKIPPPKRIPIARPGMSAPVKLAWEIDGIPLDATDPRLIMYPNERDNSIREDKATIGLELKMETRNSTDGNLKMKCIGTIGDGFYRGETELEVWEDISTGVSAGSSNWYLAPDFKFNCLVFVVLRYAIL